MTARIRPHLRDVRIGPCKQTSARHRCSSQKCHKQSLAGRLLDLVSSPASIDRAAMPRAVSILVNTLAAKRLELLHELVPTATP